MSTAVTDESVAEMPSPEGTERIGEVSVSDFSITFESAAGEPLFLPISGRFDRQDITTDKANIRSGSGTPSPADPEWQDGDPTPRF